jgi:V8-like Glu-specific endopeptidase
MVELRSVSNPVDDLESLSETEASRKLLPGKTGSLTFGGDNRAGNQLLVHGKEEPGDLIPWASVIGVDDRTRILETEADPWRMICALRIQSQYGTFIGTGWFAGPKTLITAGHCVYDEVSMEGWTREIEVSPGRNGDETPFASVVSKRFSTLDRWQEARDPNFDVGAIHLEEPLGEELGWFSTVSLPASELENYRVNISGYPADRGHGQEQWFHANRILRVSPRRIFYDVDTFGGQSGSPVWIYESEGSHPLVVGIHAYGVGGTPDHYGIKANSAPRIIADVFDIIEAWVESDSNS